MKKTRIVFINDDPEDRRLWLRWARDKKYIAHAVDNILDANKIPGVDYYVFDISVVCPILSLHMAYSPICTLAENHPGATIVIVSAIGEGSVDDIVEEVKERTGIDVINGGWGCFDDFEKATRL